MTGAGQDLGAAREAELAFVGAMNAEQRALLEQDKSRFARMASQGLNDRAAREAAKIEADPWVWASPAPRIDCSSSPVRIGHVVTVDDFSDVDQMEDYVVLGRICRRSELEARIGQLREAYAVRYGEAESKVVYGRIYVARALARLHTRGENQ